MPYELDREVQGTGPEGGLLILGEAPGADEVVGGKPFIGKAGKLLRGTAARAGLDLSQARIENVVERRPKDNDIHAVPLQELCEWREDALQRVARARPRVIVACGDTALQTLCSGIGISSGQCYILDSHRSELSGIPIVPVYHPAFIFRQPDYEHWLRWGLQKAKRLLDGAQRDPALKPQIAPSYEAAMEYLHSAREAPRVAIDIEVARNQEITCIAVAKSPSDVMSIPFAKERLEDYFEFPEEQAIWYALAELMEHDNEKIFQNFIFDTMYLARYGVRTRGPLYDTLVVANVLNPELPKGLDDLGRLHCMCPPWKNNKDYQLDGDPLKFWVYNATDAARTFQIAEDQERWLTARGLQAFYDDRVKPLLPLVLDTCSRGMRVSQEARASLNDRIRGLLEPVYSQLRELGDPLVPPKEVKRKRKTGTVIELKKQPFNPSSNKQIKECLSALGYRLPTKDSKESSDRNALLKLNRKEPCEFIRLLLQHSRLAKLESSYADVALDEDGRCRYTFNIGGTKSGRFSSSATPWETGLNIQTIPRKDPTYDLNFRRAFIADEGMQLLQVDLSQAELRVVAWVAREEKLTRLLEDKEDVHAYTAREVERISGLPCPRQLGKRINHAANYGMGPTKFADSCLVESDLAITENQARLLLDARAKAFPAIPIWHQHVERELRKTRRLVSPHGRERYFFTPIITPATIREALSFIPQATVVDTLNAVWRDISRIPGYNDFYNVLQQGHDSLLIQVRSESIDDLVAILNKAFAAQEVIIHGVPRLIPWDISVGSSWGDLHAYQP